MSDQNRIFNEIVTILLEIEEGVNEKYKKQEIQKQNEQGEYAIYVKINLILAEGDVDLNHAECQDRLIRIKTGLADLINIPFGKTPLKMVKPNTTIVSKAVRSDTSKPEQKEQQREGSSTK